MKSQLVARQPGAECVFELVMGSLHHAVALWVEHSCYNVVDAQPLEERQPYMSCKLGSLVCCHCRWHAEPGDSGREEGGSADGGFHILQRHHLQPSCGPVHHCKR
jgi:hypothetical protein